MGDVAANLTADDIGAHPCTVGRPEPDLVIRTSGQVRARLLAGAERRETLSRATVVADDYSSDGSCG